MPAMCFAPRCLLFHINALNLRPALLSGGRVVFEPRFPASEFWATMRTNEATVVYLLGRHGAILLAQPESPAERAHRVRIGLGPGVPAEALEAFRARTGVTLLEGYGSTETNFVIATAPDSPRRSVMGWLRPGFQARVVDEHDIELPPGDAGELVLRADEPFAFATGYFGMPEDRRSLRNLWFHTGDRWCARPTAPFAHRPHQGRDPPARREHLVVGGRAGAAPPSRRGRAAVYPCARSSRRTR